MTKRLPLLAACLLLAAAPLYANDAEDAAAKTVKRLGGGLTSDETDPARPVVGVDLAGVAVADGDLKTLTALKQLKTLDLSVCLAVTDAGLKHLTALKRLEVLNLGYTGTTDASVTASDLSKDTEGLRRP
jgi:hypothetical protein